MCLKGAAFENVRFFLLNPQNVEYVIETLQRLYGRPELLLDNQMKKVKALPTITENSIHEMIMIPFSIKI